MGSPLWFIRIAFNLFKKSILIAKLSNAPLIGRIMDKILFDGDDITYLPKDSVIHIDKNVEEHENIVLPSKILEELIDKATHIFKMNFCPCRTTLECENYPRDLGCLFLGEAATQINPELGRMISKGEAIEHLQQCRDAGLVHMTGRQRLDAIWMNAWPVEKLLSICNCCDCCCLWRMTPHIHPSIGQKIKRMEGVKVEVTSDCTGCGTCVANGCFVNALSMVNGKALISDACRGCGRCVEVCPENAILLTIEKGDFYETTLKHVSNLVDIS